MDLSESPAQLLLSLPDGDGPWTEPSGWSTEDPVVYRQFEDSARLTLHNGAVITTGKVNLYFTTTSMGKLGKDIRSEPSLSSGWALSIQPAAVSSHQSKQLWSFYYIIRYFHKIAKIGKNGNSDSTGITKSKQKNPATKCYSTEH